MNKTNLAAAISMVLLVSTLSACGGGSGGASAPGTDITSSGTITQFGSVYVNGVRYETSGARIISSDDNSVVLSNPSNAQLREILSLGQVVTVRGSRSDSSNGSALSILFDDELVGEVSSVSTTDASFVVLGQTISVTPQTIIDDSLIERVRGTELLNDLAFGDASLTETLDQLIPAGTLVEVSGFPSQNGFEATRIEDKTGATGVGGGNLEAEVKGTVTNLTSSQFNLNNLIVFYDAIVLDDEDFANTLLADGQFVEVHGNATSATELNATRIELEDNLLGDSNDLDDEFEIEGVITDIQADAQGTGGIITINGMDIPVDDISGFAEGLRVEIKGIPQADGSLSISRIKDESEDSIRLQDRAVSADATSFVTRLGLTITPTDRSRLEDDSIENDDNLSISAFLGNVTGKSIEARGFPQNDTTAWTRLEIEDSTSADCRIRGRVADKTGDASSFTFTIEGITINTDSVSENNFEDGSDISIGRNDFFAQLDDGDIVQAQSDIAGLGCTNGMLTARQVEFEPANNVLFGSSDDNSNAADAELIGTVSNITETTFDLGGETITVNDATIIDDSIIEAARGVEVVLEEALGNISETLPELLSDGMALEVKVDRSNGVVALSIEDI